MLENFRKYKKLEFFLVFYILFFIIIYFLHKNEFIKLEIIYNLIEYGGIISFLFLGMLYSTATFAPMVAAILIFYSGEIPAWQIILLVALGVALADLTTYEVLKYKVHSQIKELENSSLVKFFTKLKLFQNKVFMTFLGFILLALPLPDSLGIMLIEEEDILKTKSFFIIDFILNVCAIYIYLNI